MTGFNYGYYVGWSPHDARFEEADRTFALMERIRGWCEAGLCRPHVDRTFRLDLAAEAMRALLERTVTGRVAIVTLTTLCSAASRAGVARPHAPEAWGGRAA